MRVLNINGCPAALLALALALGLACNFEARAAEPQVDFSRDIKPILAAQCYDCHGARKVKGGLRLDIRADALRGGDSKEPIIVPVQPDQSGLIKRVLTKDADDRMPQKADPLPPAQIALLKAWISQGAPWPAGADDVASSGRPAEGMIISDKERSFWSFRPVTRVEPPPVKNTRWALNPIDQFILAKLESEGLSPSPPASKRELIRRITFDLTGLPPTLAEIQAFLGDDSSQAYERLVDRLLASPHYGERWGQHWLDVVRYAETEGFEYDNPVPDSWRYRDYVIRAFNNNVPYDRFVTAQLAGDEIAPDDREMQVAAGFHRLGAVRRNAGNQKVTGSRNEVLTERTDIIGSAFIGLTVGCARCHDHKFDPIRQKDYYQLQAFLAATEEHDIELANHDEYGAWKAREKAVKEDVKKLGEELKLARGEEEIRISQKIKEVEKSLPPRPPAIASVRNDYSEFAPIHILNRGEWEKPGEQVGMKGLTVLLPGAAAELPPKLPNPRTTLAKWITDPRHPLTARVLANRVWQYHFGQGIVKTPNDFGANGDRPSHPQLLDYLAGELIASQWRLKPLHRMILLSNTYRQSSASPADPRARRRDPENRLLSHFNRHRLEAEELRDAMLAVSGRLNPTAGGPSVLIPVDEELVGLLYKPSQWTVTLDPSEHDRRSVYLIAKRNLRLPFMQVFDQPMLQTSCPRRESSTHAPQALELLNGRIANDLASAFAVRLQREAGSDRAFQIDRAFQLAVGRDPTRQEETLAREFLKQQPLKEFALALFNLNAFLYVN
jgi:mono/diheme cytochrome c family protein